MFLYSLNWVTQYREEHVSIIWLLPAVGFFIGWLYWHYGHDANRGNHLIFEEIHNPKKVVPFRMAPFIFVGTVLTHWFGGSAGREGTAVQMGASLADQLSIYFKLAKERRRNLLMAGLGAGFGTAIGAPWAGFIFGLEVIGRKKLYISSWYECLVAAWVGYGVTLLLHAPHSKYPVILNFISDGRVHSIFDAANAKNLFFVVFSVAAAGVAFGLTARFFSICVHWFELQLNKLIKYPPVKPLVGGLLLVVFYYLEGSYHYAGLGISWIQNALNSQVSFSEPAYKMFFTILTVGSGFKGGEFIPLVFIGTALGSALSAFLPASPQLLAITGFAAVFAGAGKVPLACAMMAAEIFGWQVAPYALLACLVSHYVSGRRGIYHD